MIWAAAGLAIFLALCAGGGLAWGGYRAAQSPTFWGDVAAAAWAAIGPSLADLVKSSPAIQAEAQQRAREGHMGDPHAGREK